MRSRLCIMTAYADETRALLRALGQDSSDPVDWNGRLRFEGRDGGSEWRVVQSGMGKVRAASMCQMIIDEYRVDTFFEFGFAGGLTDTVGVGDFVLINGVSELDAPNRPEIRSEQDSLRAHLFLRSTSSINRFERSLSAVSDVTPRKASVICGDMDIYDRNLRDEVAAKSGAAATNWESAAIVDVCAINNIEYVGVRIISDACVEEDRGPVSKARFNLLLESTTAYVNALVDFNREASNV